MDEPAPATDFLTRFATHGDRTATLEDRGRCTYRQLLDAADRLATTLAATWTERPSEARDRAIAVDVEPSREWLVAVLAIWRLGGVAVPLAIAHPERELEYTLDDSGVLGGSRTVIATAAQADRLAGLVQRHGLRRIDPVDDLAPEPHPPTAAPAAEDPALLIYTSGTTGRPKGVPLSHGNLAAQIAGMVEAWGWTADDRIVEVLPLHHLHGIVNVMLTASWTGASIRIVPRFDAERVWQVIAEDAPTVLMAVPTIYNRLLGAWDGADEATRERWSAAAATLRLFVSGSAALPVPTLERWRAITGHTLLERYGMSEIGIALSNPLDGERLPGKVGHPMPGAELRIVDADGRAVDGGTSGELEVRGPTVFAGYWYRPEATDEAFRDDDEGRSWFRTGDVAVVEDGAYRLLGRSSVDILKSGGEKVSALEVEAVLREHPAIRDLAVVGLPDPSWGQCIVAAVELVDPATDIEALDLRAWAKDRLAVYKVPRQFRAVDTLPRNALGKVQKPRVAKLFESG